MVKFFKLIITNLLIAVLAGGVGFLLGESAFRAKAHHYTILLLNGTYSESPELEDFIRVQLYSDAVRGFIRDKSLLDRFDHKPIQSANSSG